MWLYHGVPQAGSGSFQSTGAPAACSRTSACTIGVATISPEFSACATPSALGQMQEEPVTTDVAVALVGRVGEGRAGRCHGVRAGFGRGGGPYRVGGHMHIGGSAPGAVLGLDPGIDLHIGTAGELQGDARVFPLERGFQLREVVRVRSSTHPPRIGTGLFDRPEPVTPAGSFPPNLVIACGTWLYTGICRLRTGSRS